MKRSLLMSVCAATLVAMSLGQAMADNLQLTLDLINTVDSAPQNGGTWTLWARVDVTGTGVSGTPGIAGLRALVDNINLAGITFGPDAALFSNDPLAQGAKNFQVVPGDSNGTIEIVYGQNLAVPTLAGVGVPPATPVGNKKDVLIASGTFPGGGTVAAPIRPSFGIDDKNGGNFASDGGFLNGSNAATTANAINTAVVTLGDFNGSHTVSNSDTQLYINTLAAGAAGYNPAGDFNQSGTVSNSDTQLYINRLAAPITANVGAVPEPSSLLLMLGGISVLGLRRRK